MLGSSTAFRNNPAEVMPAICFNNEMAISASDEARTKRYHQRCVGNLRAKITFCENRIDYDPGSKVGDTVPLAVADHRNSPLAPSPFDFGKEFRATQASTPSTCVPPSSIAVQNETVRRTHRGASSSVMQMRLIFAM